MNLIIRDSIITNQHGLVNDKTIIVRYPNYFLCLFW